MKPVNKQKNRVELGWYCSECDSPMAMLDSFCCNCGARADWAWRLPKSPRFCSICGSKLEEMSHAYT